MPNNSNDILVFSRSCLGSECAHVGAATCW